MRTHPELSPRFPDYASLDTDTLHWLVTERKPGSIKFEADLLRTAFRSRNNCDGHGPTGWREIARTRVRMLRRIKAEYQAAQRELARRTERIGSP